MDHEPCINQLTESTLDLTSRTRSQDNTTAKDGGGPYGVKKCRPKLFSSC